MAHVQRWQTFKLLTLIGISGIFLSAIIGGHTTYACSCMIGRSLKEEYSHRSAVFEGRIIRVDKAVYGYAAIFEVTRSWKGVKDKYVFVRTGTGAGDCGVKFKVSRITFVQLSGAVAEAKNLEANICSPVFQASEVIEEFGPGTTLLRNNWYLQFVPPFWPEMLAIVMLLIMVYMFRLIRWRQKTTRERKVPPQ